MEHHGTWQFSSKKFSKSFRALFCSSSHCTFSTASSTVQPSDSPAAESVRLSSRL